MFRSKQLVSDVDSDAIQLPTEVPRCHPDVYIFLWVQEALCA